MVDRGGLTRVNQMAFQVFLATELEVRRHLHSQRVPNFKKEVTKVVLENEDVTFYWSMLSADWEEEDSQALLELVVDMFITVGGFSYTSAWMDGEIQSSQCQDIAEVQRTLEDTY